MIFYFFSMNIAFWLIHFIRKIKCTFESYLQNSFAPVSQEASELVDKEQQGGKISLA